MTRECIDLHVGNESEIKVYENKVKIKLQKVRILCEDP
jgi:hypothetical protein